jgi:hypothetical protein
MSGNRFKMSFGEHQRMPSAAILAAMASNAAAAAAASAGAPAPAPAGPPPAAKPTGLNAPMIDRVHKVRPGCSACGKKVV